MVKKFTIPFASQGDANDIPDALQVDGKVSFTQGFGYDYERPYDDPQAKDIAREDMNGLFKAITSAVGELQTVGASEWSSAISYPKGAIVYYEKDLYISQVDDNQSKPPQNWVSITSIANDSLKKAANLSDLTNKATARSNLGLGNSATLNKTDVLGTSTSLVATQKLVNDTKINLDNSVRAVDIKSDNAQNRADDAYSLAQTKRDLADRKFDAAISISGSGTNGDAIVIDDSKAVIGYSTGREGLWFFSDSKTARFPKKSGVIGIENTHSAPAGWWKCGDTGMIIQRGTFTSGGVTNFPISFSNNSVTITLGNHGSHNNADNIFITNVTATGFSSEGKSPSGGQINYPASYIAIGY